MWRTGGSSEEEKQSKHGRSQRSGDFAEGSSPARGAQPGVPVGVAVFLDDGPLPVLPEV